MSLRHVHHTLLALALVSGCEMAPEPSDASRASPDAAPADAARPDDAGDAGPVGVDARVSLPDAAPCESPPTWYRDRDRDGFGDPAAALTQCARPDGYVADGSDCDDDCASCAPTGVERCDGVDQDCDGMTDEGVQRSFYADRDGDGHGDRDAPMLACTAPAGFVDDSSDCDDACAACHPGAAEACDGVDQDCDLAVDEGVQSTFHRDADGDGWGAGATTLACAAPAGFAAMAGDCDDAAARRHPGAAEVCDGADDDCDGAPDQTFACVQGATTSCTTTCGSTGTGRCTAACGVPGPSACAPPVETCNFRDDDCDGLRDEGVWEWNAPTIEAAGRAYDRPVVVEWGSARRSFWYADGQVWGFEHSATGAVTGGAPTAVTGTRIFHAASFGTHSLVFASVFSSYVILQRLSSDLRVRWSTTIPISASQVRVTVDRDSVYLYTVESAGRVRRRVYRLTDHAYQAGPLELGRTARPIAVAQASPGSDVVAFSRLDLGEVELRWVQGAGASPTVTSRTLPSANPVMEVAVETRGGGTPDAMVAWSTRGGAASDSEIRYGYLSSPSAVAVAGRVTTGTTPNDPPDATQRLGIDVQGDRFFLGVVHTSAFPVGDTGTPRAFQLFLDGGVRVFEVTRVDAGGAFHTAAFEGLAVTYAQARLWYAPPGGGVASRWANCFSLP